MFYIIARRRRKIFRVMNIRNTIFLKDFIKSEVKFSKFSAARPNSLSKKSLRNIPILTSPPLVSGCTETRGGSPKGGEARGIPLILAAWFRVFHKNDQNLKKNPNLRFFIGKYFLNHFFSSKNIFNTLYAHQI